MRDATIPPRYCQSSNIVFPARKPEALIWRRMKRMKTAITTFTVAGLLAQTPSSPHDAPRAIDGSDKRLRHAGEGTGKTMATTNRKTSAKPALAPSGIVYNGRAAEGFGSIQSSRGYPDGRSFRKKFGLVIPATNTSMEHELWSLIFANPRLRGVGLHTVNVITPSPKLETDADLLNYQKQFLGGLKGAVDAARLADPEYMI